MVASVGLRVTLCKQPIFVRQTLVRNKRKLGNKKRILKSNFGICVPTIPKKKEVNFKATPKESELTYRRIGDCQQRNSGKMKKNKKKSLADVNTIKMTKLDRIINELISQDIKIQKIKIDNEADVRKLKECLAQGLKIAEIKCALHERLTWQITSRLPFTKLPRAVDLPLQNHVNKPNNAEKAMKMVLEYERLNEEQSENIGELKHVLEAVEKKHAKWSQKFTHYKLENFTILDQYGVARSSSTQYLGKFGCMHETPLHFMSDIGIVP